jgi:hypothetical protein
VPVIELGLKPALEMPGGIPPSLPTVRATAPLKPVNPVTFTVKVADWPGTTVFDVGVTLIEKLGDDGVTVIFRVTGLGSEFPLLSITVSDAIQVPGVPKTTFPSFPGVFAVDVAGVPLGKIQEYFAAVVVVLNSTDPPAGIVTSEAGAVMTPTGGRVVNGVSWMKRALEGTPAASSRKSM